MPTPFPGMDPYLERADLWQQLHTGLIVEIQHFLSQALRPRYYVAIEQLTYLTVLTGPDDRVGRPDVIVSGPRETEGPALAPVSAAVANPVIGELPQPEEIKQRYLEIRRAESHQVVTAIELLSSANKIGREGREQYERKRLKILGSQTNLVEIDLLRAGKPMPMKTPHSTDYRIVISRSPQRPLAAIYLFSLRQPIPDIPIPLQPGEAEPTLPLNRLFHQLYDKGGYDLMVDYGRPPIPVLSEADRAWAARLLS